MNRTLTISRKTSTLGILGQTLIQFGLWCCRAAAGTVIGAHLIGYGRATTTTTIGAWEEL